MTTPEKMDGTTSRWPFQYLAGPGISCAHDPHWKALLKVGGCVSNWASKWASTRGVYPLWFRRLMLVKQ